MSGTKFVVVKMKELVKTAVFAVLALRGEVGQDFMTVYTVIIAFYFGTQSERKLQSGVNGQ